MDALKLLPIARAVASLSKDPSTKVGALIVGPAGEVRSSGWNGFPRGVADNWRLHDRPTKYLHIVHAEINAICNAARAGTPIDGCTLLVTALHPCNECCKAIIQSGIRRVLAPATEAGRREDWARSFQIAAGMFEEAGVAVEFYTDTGG